MSFPRACLDCGLKTDPGKSRCPAHDAQVNAYRSAKKRRRRGPTPVADKLYRALRKAYQSNCEECGLRYYSSELRVDHIVPLADGGLDASANLQILCNGCHLEKTARENRERYQ